jgi:hypothetical protein
VIADGRTVAVSGADGFALVRLAKEPDSIEYGLAGWNLHESDGHHGLIVVGLRRE